MGTGFGMDTGSENRKKIGKEDSSLPGELPGYTFVADAFCFVVIIIVVIIIIVPVTRLQRPWDLVTFKLIN